jgi:hypothetical protein
MEFLTNLNPLLKQEAIHSFLNLPTSKPSTPIFPNSSKNCLNSWLLKTTKDQKSLPKPNIPHQLNPFTAIVTFPLNGLENRFTFRSREYKLTIKQAIN